MMDGQSEDLDLFSLKFKQDPFPTYAWMRMERPIYRHVTPAGAVIWYFTRYDDVLAILRDHERFVKDYRNAMAPGAPPPPAANVHESLNQNMLFSDPPDHTRLRVLVSQAFTPRRVAAMAPRVAAITSALLDGAAPAGQMDLIAALALPLPVIVICELLGIPEADHDRVADWSGSIISPGSRGLSFRQRKRNVRALLAFFRELFAARRAQPRDDLITGLVQAEAAGDRLTDAELSSMVALLLVTGHETTVNLIGNGALALLLHPEQRRRALAAPETWPRVVNELLRYDGPVETSTTRWVARDCRFRGHQMRRGEVVRVVLASANRDACVFDRPDELDVTRPDNRHLAFGYGIHYCLGAALAQQEGEIALAALFERWPQLALAVPPAALQWRSGVLFRGLQELPVRW